MSNTNTTTAPARQAVSRSPKDRQRRIATAKYLLLVEGRSQAQVAIRLRIAPKTVCHWVKQFGWKEEAAALRQAASIKALGLEDSLAAFMAYVRIHHRTLHEALQEAHSGYTEHSNRGG